MRRRKLVRLVALVALAVLLGAGLARQQPTRAAVATADSQCTPLDANTAACSLTLSGSLVAGEALTVAISTGTFDQVSYADGCQPVGVLVPPAIAAGGASVSFAAPAGDCSGPIMFTEVVGGFTAPNVLVQSVTDSGAPGVVLNTAVYLVAFSGSKSCAETRGSGSDDGDDNGDLAYADDDQAPQVSCTLTLQPSVGLTAGSVVAVTIAGNASFAAVSHMSGCAGAAAIAAGGGSFSFTVPAGGCSGPLVFAEALSVTGAGGGALAQAVNVAGTSSGSAAVQATSSDGSAFTLPIVQPGNGNGNGQGNGNGNGQGNGNNHSVPACQNSHGRAPEHNPHCRGGDD